MTIETKFNGKQKIYYISGTKIAIGYVKKINVECWHSNRENPIVTYDITEDFNCTRKIGVMEEDLLFENAEELTESLLIDLKEEEKKNRY